jgi:hypothetical protein
VLSVPVDVVSRLEEAELTELAVASGSGLQVT